jgi:hypothetical protein
VTNTVVATTPNTNVVGLYTLTYTVTNADGYSKSNSRKVLVYDADGVITNDISGTYVSNQVRTVLSTSVTALRGPFDMTLTELAPGHYTIGDLLGGWYWIGGGASYAAYHYDGILRITTAGTVTALCINAAPWGGAVSISAGTYDAATNTISFNATGDADNGLIAYRWAVTLIKK